MHFTISPTGLSPPTVGLPRPFGYHDLSIMKVLQPRINPVWALPTSLAATTGIDFSFFSSRYLDVSVPWVCLLYGYVFTIWCQRITTSGFPHSDTPGSLCTYHSPRHFAVSRVLRQLLVPRHPPYALTYLITCKFALITGVIRLSFYEDRLIFVCLLFFDCLSYCFCLYIT